jgi:hypothetical protein
VPGLRGFCEGYRGNVRHAEIEDGAALIVFGPREVGWRSTRSYRAITLWPLARCAFAQAFALSTLCPHSVHTLSTLCPHSVHTLFHTLRAQAFALSKLAQILYMRALSERLEAARLPVAVHAVHPGLTEHGVARFGGLEAGSWLQAAVAAAGSGLRAMGTLKVCVCVCVCVLVCVTHCVECVCARVAPLPPSSLDRFPVMPPTHARAHTPRAADAGPGGSERRVCARCASGAACGACQPRRCRRARAPAVLRRQNAHATQQRWRRVSPPGQRVWAARRRRRQRKRKQQAGCPRVCVWPLHRGLPAVATGAGGARPRGGSGAVAGGSGGMTLHTNTHARTHTAGHPGNKQ